MSDGVPQRAPNPSNFSKVHRCHPSFRIITPWYGGWSGSEHIAGRGGQSSVGRFRSRRVIRTFRELLKQEPALECWAMHTRLLFFVSIASLTGSLCLLPAAAAQSSSVHLL